MAANFRIIGTGLVLLSLALYCSCTPEWKEPAATLPEDHEITSVLHYTATASEGTVTKAALNNILQYVFESGDQLYVVDSETGGSKVYGVMSLISGIASTTASFEGDLMCLDGFTPTESTSLDATLVSRSDVLHTCSGGKITLTQYPESGGDAFAADLTEAVRKFGNFTATGTYSSHAFSLEQQSAFLIFSVVFDEGTLAGETEITAQIINEVGATTLRTGTVTTRETDFSVHADFVAAFPSITLDRARVSFSNGGTPISSYDDIASDEPVTLVPNRYYEISRTDIDLSCFTIQAKEDGTSVTFNHSGSGIQYKVGSSGTWTAYDGSAIPLDAREYVQFRGQKNTYTGATNGSLPLFTSDKSCFVYGDIMSLVSDSGYIPKTAAANFAFRYSFKNATWVDIPSGRPLILSASTIGESCYEEMFYGCTGLTHAPELPAASVPRKAYKNMFRGCTSLSAAPDLPAENVGEEGYYSMFQDCTSLTGVPASLEGTSGNSACRQMFEGCTSLSRAPELSSPSVGAHGYQRMFAGCRSLVRAPELPATTIQESSYQELFINCTSLVSAPSSLPATTLASACYRSMFNGCSALSSAPSNLPAATVQSYSYYQMFRGCISLGTAPDLSSLVTIGSYGCYQMFYGCTSLVSVTGLYNVTSVGNNGCNQMFFNCGELITTPSRLPATSLPEYAYNEMYRGCAKITRAPEILSSEVSAYSLKNMFYGCRRLQAPPSVIYVEVVANQAFSGMFSGCTALASAPDMSSIRTVEESGCHQMFYECSNLRTPPDLPALTLGKNCYQEMFYNSGIETPPSLPATTLAEGCYNKMMKSCKYLSGQPLLPATELVKNCYLEMFNGAKLLNVVICLATDHSAEGCTTNWLSGVSSEGKFIRPSGVAWTTSSASGIPVGWTPSDFGIEPIFPEEPFDPEEDF